jgi:GAF domain-containing protein
VLAATDDRARRVGVLAFGSRSPAPYTDDIAAFMAQIAAVVAIAVGNGINWDHAQQYQAEPPRRARSPAVRARRQQRIRYPDRAAASESSRVCGE